jgi:hypothetical protein
VRISKDKITPHIFLTSKELFITNLFPQNEQSRRHSSFIQAFERVWQSIRRKYQIFCRRSGFLYHGSVPSHTAPSVKLLLGQKTKISGGTFTVLITFDPV